MSVEDFSKVVIPTVVNNRSMRQNDSLLKLTSLDDFQRNKGFAIAHFRVN